MRDTLDEEIIHDVKSITFDYETSEFDKSLSSEEIVIMHEKIENILC